MTLSPLSHFEMAFRYGEPVSTNVAELWREIDLAKGLGPGGLSFGRRCFRPIFLDVGRAASA